MHPHFMAMLFAGISARSGAVFAAAAFAAVSCLGQAGPDAGQAAAPAIDQQGIPAKTPSSAKRILWVIPNYRTFPTLTPYRPITPRAKFKIARDDSFDRGTIALAAAFAGEGQLKNSNPTFGQGVLGYGHYFVTAYSDLIIGDYMTEAIYPTLLHQDPRYFRRGTGSAWSRLGYAMGQIFWTHTDAGGTQFNYSEVIGNSTAVAISTSYYSEGRDPTSAVSKLGTQLGVDMAGNVLKEFWPDLQHRFQGHRREPVQ